MRFAFEYHQRDGRERAQLFLPRCIDAVKVDLRYAQRAAGACNLDDGSEASGLGGGEEIDLVFGCQQPLPGLDQRSRSASAGCVSDCAEEPTVKETVLL